VATSLFRPLRPALLIALATIGCDGNTGLNGVGRTFQLGQLPDMNCVEQVLRKLPGVSNVSHSEVRSPYASEPTVSADDPARPVFHSYHYQYSGITAGFSFVRDELGDVQFWQGLQCFNCVVEQEHVNRLRPFMDRFEERLEAACGIRGLRAGTSEICNHVDCSAPVATAQ
jgi:hypothetical protein